MRAAAMKAPNAIHGHIHILCHTPRLMLLCVYIKLHTHSHTPQKIGTSAAVLGAEIPAANIGVMLKCPCSLSNQSYPAGEKL